jgi:uncharacterized protein YggE
MLRIATSLLLAATTLVTLAHPARAQHVTRSVTVTGTAVAKVKPDIVVWTINVTTTDATLKVARDANDESTRKVLALRGELKIDAQDVQTGHLRIEKVFERDRSGNQGVFRHYSFHRTILLRQRDTAKIDDVLQDLTGTKNLEISYALEAANFHKVRRETRLRAVKVAKEKASEMTLLLGAKLGHVLEIHETSSGHNSWYASEFSNTSFPIDPPAQPDDIVGTFAPGSIDISVSVNIRFAIE